MGSTVTKGGPEPLPAVLPVRHAPRVAELAGGPFLAPEHVTPSEWAWNGALTYDVRTDDGREYRALRITTGRNFVGYWAIQQIGGPPLSD